MNALQDQHVLILGLGISGLSMARWCVRHGAQVTVADTRENPPSLAALRAECPSVDFVQGAFDETLLARAAWNVIARSPGLPPEQLAPARAWAQSHGAALVGELELFAQALCDLSQREGQPYRPKVLAITGTNGKTTVTSLTGLLLQRAGLRVAVAGNIGPALLDVLSASLDAEREAVAQDAARAAEEAAQAPAEVVQDTPEVPASAEADDGAEEGVEQGESLQDAAAAADDEGPTLLVPPPPPEPEPPHLPQAWTPEIQRVDGHSGSALRASIPFQRTNTELLFEGERQAIRQFLSTSEDETKAAKIFGLASAQVELKECGCGEEKRDGVTTDQIANGFGFQRRWMKHHSGGDDGRQPTIDRRNVRIVDLLHGGGEHAAVRQFGPHVQGPAAGLPGRGGPRQLERFAGAGRQGERDRRRRRPSLRLHALRRRGHQPARQLDGRVRREGHPQRSRARRVVAPHDFEPGFGGDFEGGHHVEGAAHLPGNLIGPPAHHLSRHGDRRVADPQPDAVFGQHEVRRPHCRVAAKPHLHHRAGVHRVGETDHRGPQPRIPAELPADHAVVQHVLD